MATPSSNVGQAGTSVPVGKSVSAAIDCSLAIRVGSDPVESAFGLGTAAQQVTMMCRPQEVLLA